MKKALLTLSLVIAFALQTLAQELPQPSPTATLQQRVGLTDIEIKYSRPSVNEREIFGDLVKFGEMWRTGANKATSITFSTPVRVGDVEVEAGTYSLFTIPGATDWIIILNKNTELWGTNGYEEKDDVARVKITPQQGEYTETFTIDVNNIRKDGADIILSWDMTTVALPIHMKVAEQAERNIEAAIKEKGDWITYRNAASYYNREGQKEKALEMITKAVELKDDNWYAHWLHAEILASNNKKAEARKAAQKALEVGKSDSEKTGRPFTYEKMITASIEEWK